MLELLAQPRVAVVDDVRDEVAPIIEELQNRSIYVEYFNSSPEELQQPEHPIESIELIFLDLYYNQNFNSTLEPDRCAQMIEGIVPEGKHYTLVIWSRDPDNADQVLQILSEINLSPAQTIIKSKSDYYNADHLDVEKLLSDIDFEASQKQNIIEIFGEIIIVDEDNVIVDCLIDVDQKLFQRRRFDRAPFEDVISIHEGQHIIIKIITKPGKKIFEFNNAPDTISRHFNRDNYFDGIDFSIFNPD